MPVGICDRMTGISVLTERRHELTLRASAITSPPVSDNRTQLKGVCFPFARHRRADPSGKGGEERDHTISLQPRTPYTLTEVAVRWDCSIADIVEGPFSGHMEILVAIPPTSFGGQLFSGMVAPSDVLRMFPRSVTGQKER